MAILHINFSSLLIGFAGVAISLLLALENTAFLLVVPAYYLAAACFIDTFFSKIPNILNLILFGAGAIYNLWVAGLAGFGTALVGCIVGFSLLLIPYLMGGGDVKALAALGALLGPVTIVQVFLYIALFGGLFSILHYLFSRNFLEKAAGAGRALMAFAGTRDVEVLRPATTEKLRFPYASAIAFGFFSYVQWGSIFTLLKSL
ncbi:prepilin peptidase [Geoalkalibacter sp.]|uniref:prepilin peptidase n=1 Tax=Geoalkalibacter sp. TaxID=3041440 RepID=UPI00272E946F|nr:prepilin peptidase [Geoalkalibacter sp.]